MIKGYFCINDDDVLTNIKRSAVVTTEALFMIDGFLTIKNNKALTHLDLPLLETVEGWLYSQQRRPDEYSHTALNNLLWMTSLF